MVALFYNQLQLFEPRWVWGIWRRDSMLWYKSALSALLTGIILSAALAVSVTAQVPIHTGPSTGAKPVPRAQKEPCWEVAGVTKAAMQERRAISRQARQEVEAVCSNSSLSVQQKRAEIQQIRARERQQIDAIISGAQREAMRSCQASRGGGHGGGGHFGGGGGPCGEMSTGHNPHPMHEQEEDDLPPTDAPKPN
jgi:uncharacterized membrane protein YgcG